MMFYRVGHTIPPNQIVSIFLKLTLARERVVTIADHKGVLVKCFQSNERWNVYFNNIQEYRDIEQR